MPIADSDLHDMLFRQSEKNDATPNKKTPKRDHFNEICKSCMQYHRKMDEFGGR